jgi:hypothetical protein
LSSLLTTMKERTLRVWKWAPGNLRCGWQWLMRPRETIEWKTVRTSISSQMPKSIASWALMVVVLIVVLVIIVPWLWKWYTISDISKDGTTVYPHASFLNPILAGAGAAFLIYAAIRQARTASLQAEIASGRHHEQTNADRQRRITESFSKAVEQLGSDKLEVRLGGIYSLERISKESLDDYWTVMENLTAFVRERSRRNEAERTSQELEQRVSRRAYFLWLEAGCPDGRAEEFWVAAANQEEFGQPLITDIIAVLTVIKRRSEQSRDNERTNEWRFNLSGAVLRRADLSKAHLQGANLSWAQLTGARLEEAHLQGAFLVRTHLERAVLEGTHLEEAALIEAHLQGANLSRAHLQGANLSGAHLQGAALSGAHLQGTTLLGAHLEKAALYDAHLEGAYLVGAHLQGAALSGAHLEKADLRRANLEGAFLIGMHMEGANFVGANLCKAVGLWKEDLGHASGDASTLLSNEMDRPAHWPSKANQALPESPRTHRVGSWPAIHKC